MQKFEELKELIQQSESEKALSLCDELYNDLRDFSQCVDIVEQDGQINMQMNSFTTGERTKSLKTKIQTWVGGH